MKYKDLISFDPITSVIKLSESGDNAKDLVKSFVFSDTMKEKVEARFVRNLDINNHDEKFGIQVVGSYGTGKSHLMALISAIAEDESYLEYLNEPDLQDSFKKFAGSYNVLRFEIATNLPLSEVISHQLNRYLDELDVSFKLDPSPQFGWPEQIEEMIAAYQQTHPDKHMLIVVDEMLEYLKGKDPRQLNNDLTVLRSLGEACNNSRFKFVFGVQERLYNSPDFQHQAEMLQKVQDRYNDLIITKEDISFVVQQRLLKKNEDQKEQIREHVLEFSHLFDGINNHLNKYVNLFPVHPDYIDQFEQIKHGKSQREILKVLSIKFKELADQKVPSDSPGLLTYDSYWKEIEEDASLTAIPDIGKVKDKMGIINDRIESHFSDNRSELKPVAYKLSQALAIKALCDDLDKKNGATANALKESLCITDKNIDDPELLTAQVKRTAEQLIKATSGQYFEKSPQSGEYYLRVEGGVNIQQIIKEYAEDVLSKDLETADEYFFDFLQHVLEMEVNTYRAGFNIWQHTIEWNDKKTFRRGYIFLGNPDERSTTEPEEDFYLFFGPIFGKFNPNKKADEIYFDLTDLSEDFRNEILLYGAAKAKHSSATSDQKRIYKGQIEAHKNKALEYFNNEYVHAAEVLHKQNKKDLSSFSLPGTGTTPIIKFDHVAELLLNPVFEDRYPDYPSFNRLMKPITQDNFEGMVSNALKKIIKPQNKNSDGEAILEGLGIWNGNRVDLEQSKYASYYLNKVDELDDGSVLNREELLTCHSQKHNLWYDVEFHLEHELLFIILTAMAYEGEIEISWSGQKQISASNINEVTVLSSNEYFTFRHIKKPKGVPTKALKALFRALDLPDMTAQLDKPGTVPKIETEAQNRVEKVAEETGKLVGGIYCRDIPLLTDAKFEEYQERLSQLKDVLDKIIGFDTYGRLKNFSLSAEEIEDAFEAWPLIDEIKQLRNRASQFDDYASYLEDALHYVAKQSKVKLYKDIEEALQELPTKLNGEEDELKQYQAKLKDLKDRYSEYYRKNYHKYRLSKDEARRKEQLVNSDKKHICDILRDVPYISDSSYQTWRTQLSRLKKQEKSLSEENLERTAYHGFDPKEYVEKNIYRIGELEDQLDDIYDDLIQKAKDVFDDPSAQKNLDLLADDTRNLVQKFTENGLELDEEKARKIRDAIGQVVANIERIEISKDDFKQYFSRPLQPKEAKEAFEKMVNEYCAGKKREDVRIVLSENSS